MYETDFLSPKRSKGNKRTRGNWRNMTSSSLPYSGNETVSVAQLMKGLGDQVDVIPIPSSDTGYSNFVSIQGLEPVASYSWLASKEPTIIVPGSPPVWRDRYMPYHVPRDTGTVFRDQNASRLASSPLLPLVAAVVHHAPDFPLHSIDFITDRNGLRKLWRWTTSRDKKSSPANSHSFDNEGSFRIDVELAGKRTILLERWETEATQVGGPGYEREFEAASTTPAKGCERATGHHRIVTYDFSGLKMLMRCKVDTCLPVEAVDKQTEADSLDDLVSGLHNLSVQTLQEAKTVQVPTFGGASLSILSRGTLVPQANLIELKTRSYRSIKNFEWDDTYPQLLLSQTPHLFVCVHERGEFKEVRKKSLTELETQAVAREAQEGLRKLRKVLGEIADVVRGEGEGARLSLVCKDRGDIVVYERKGTRGCLPDKILAKFSS